MQEEHRRCDRGNPERNVHPECPAPADALGEPPAQQWASDRRQREDATHDAHVPAPLAGRYDVSDDRLREDHEPATAEALDRTASNAVSYTHLRAHETVLDLVCRLLLEK